MQTEAPRRGTRAARSIGVVAGGAIDVGGLVARLGYRPVDALGPADDYVAALIADDAKGRSALQACEAVSRSTPVLMLAPEPDFAYRLAAKRAGASSVLPTPPDPVTLVDWIRQFDTTLLAPTRVLLVDDDEFAAEAYGCILQLAGFEVHVETDAARVLEAIDAFRPDLLLLDMNLNGMNGLEVAGVIRQDRAVLALPILFLSGERDRGRRMAARRVGGDEFIPKSIPSGELVEIVRMRAERARSLGDLAARDGLTGLLNHGAFKGRLEDALARGARDLSVALIDIDRFKAINDTHGHPVGDDVLRSVARTLCGGLRSSDVVARYGGEEFAALLVDRGPDKGVGAVERLRASFAAAPVGARGIRATFSAGIAAHDPTSPGDASVQDGKAIPSQPPPDAAAVAEALIARADEALYAAKRAGRNRVSLAP